MSRGFFKLPKHYHRNFPGIYADGISGFGEPLRVEPYKKEHDWQRLPAYGMYWGTNPMNGRTFQVYGELEKVRHLRCRDCALVVRERYESRRRGWTVKAKAFRSQCRGQSPETRQGSLEMGV